LAAKGEGNLGEGNLVVKRKSVGLVVFKRAGKKREYLLLHYASGHWDFPKGGVEVGETEEETALRELREETGISRVKIIPGFSESIHYFFREGGKLVSKNIVFLLAESFSREVKLSFEHVGFEWLSFQQALERLTFENSKQVLEKAESFLRKSLRREEILRKKRF